MTQKCVLEIAWSGSLAAFEVPSFCQTENEAVPPAHPPMTQVGLLRFAVNNSPLIYTRVSKIAPQLRKCSA